MQDTVAVPKPVTLPGVIEPQVRPDGRVSVRLTTPVKPFTADSVIVEEMETPALTGVGDAKVRLKSCTLKDASAEWTKELLVPVTGNV